MVSCVSFCGNHGWIHEGPGSQDRTSFVTCCIAILLEEVLSHACISESLKPDAGLPGF